MKSQIELDRRSLLQLCGGAALALGLPALPDPAFGAGRQYGPINLVLFDRRYGVARFFARGSEGPGAPDVVPIGRDLAKLWYQEIAPRLAREPLSVEGVTLAADLFGLERLGEGSRAFTEAKLDLIDDTQPRRPKLLVYWRMYLGGEARAAIG
jgi:hypothetical protein